ncbi:MAG: septum formation initiator family protein [Frankiales bacterium]|nr:septum formation initiator family protein [Frankiales bacterium]
MTADRRPQTSRRKRPVNAVRRTAAPPPPSSSKAGLTTRAAILGLVVCALVVSAALPLREYLSQRGQIAAAQAKQAAAAARVQALEAQLRQLQDPAYVKAQARTRLHFVLPGETAYVVLAPSAKPVPAGRAALAGATASGPEAPWYSQVWGSVKAADRPAPLPTPKS